MPNLVLSSTGITFPDGTIQSTYSPSINNWAVKTSSYTAVAGDVIAANTTLSAFPINLPSNPKNGNCVWFTDVGNSWGTNNLTIARNGSTIRGLSEDLVCDSSGKQLYLIYSGSTWQVFISSAQSVINTMPVGSSIQTVSTSLATYSAPTTILPLDDTPPQSSEGSQILSQSINLASPTNQVKIDVSLPLMAAAVAGTWVNAALFRGTTCIDTSAFCTSNNNYGQPIAFTKYDSPGTTSNTYSVNVGPGAAGTIYVNGTAGSRMFGGTSVASLTLTEIKS